MDRYFSSTLVLSQPNDVHDYDGPKCNIKYGKMFPRPRDSIVASSLKILAEINGSMLMIYWQPKHTAMPMSSSKFGGGQKGSATPTGIGSQVGSEFEQRARLVERRFLVWSMADCTHCHGRILADYATTSSVGRSAAKRGSQL